LARPFRATGAGAQIRRTSTSENRPIIETQNLADPPPMAAVIGRHKLRIRGLRGRQIAFDSSVEHFDKPGRRDIRRRETFRGLGPRVTDSKNNFAAEILEAEVVVNHIEHGHVYHFPILPNAVNLEGSRIEANPRAKREASRYLSDALDGAGGAQPLASIAGP
jgi:hypothetical protein